MTFFKIGMPWALLLMVSSAWAQTTIRGRVYDALTKEPLTGITVAAPNTLTGAITNGVGMFVFQTVDDTLIISGVGYRKQKVRVNGPSLTVALEQAVEDLQTIVVTASREAQKRTEAPVAISKINARTIDDTKPVNVYELLNKVPGVVMLNYNNEQHGMSIRQPMGTSAYFLYLEDGIPIRPMGVFNHNALIEMNIFSFSSIEVVKGPASSLYGPEAVGGAINFIMQKPTAVPTARIGVQVDQWGYQRVQYGAGGMITPKFGLYVGGFFAKQRDSWQTRSDFDKQSFNGRADYVLSSRTRLVGSLSYNNYDSQTGGSVDSVAFYSRQYTSTTDFTYRKVKAIRSRLTLEHQWLDGSESFVTGFYRYNDYGQNPSYSLRWTAPNPTATGQINTNLFRSYGFIAQHSQKLPVLNGKWLVGASLDYSPNEVRAHQIDLDAILRPDKRSVERYVFRRDRPDIELTNYDATLRNSALYSQLDLNLTKELRVSAGLRYDRMSFDYVNYLDKDKTTGTAIRGSKAYTQLTPKVGLTYDLGRGMGLYANYAKGFSPPGLSAIFVKRPAAAPDGSLFYYNLAPATFDNYEIGGWASLLANKLYVDLALYQMNGRNELLSIRQPDNSYDYQSAGKTLHRGVEYGLTYKPGTQWFLRVGWTNALHRFDAFALSLRSSDVVKNVDGKTMPQAPSWIANAEVTYKPQLLKGFRVAVEWQRLSPWYQNQTNTVRYDDRGFLGARGMSVLNVRTGYQWKSIEVFVNVLNASDELYANSATRGNNPTDRTTYTPAAPRTFIGGIQYSFTGK